MYKLLIAGGRDFKNYNLLKRVLDALLKDPEVIAAFQALGGVEIVSGKQVTKPDYNDESTWHGADYLGEKYAKENGLPVTPFAADWNQYGKAAGMIRNKDMAHYADALIAFFDGKSRGTSNMIDLMRERAKPYNIIKY